MPGICHDGYLTRRHVLSSTGAIVAATVAAHDVAAATVDPSRIVVTARGRACTFVDLTHRLTRDFNFNQATPRIAMEPIVGSGKAVGMHLNRLTLVEHTGTHIDAPSHFAADGRNLGELALKDLIVPLAVIDIRDKARSDPDAAVERADILRWEARHGRLPAGCCVACWSGFDPVRDFVERMKLPRHPCPGFGIDAADMLINDRDVKGIAVDAMSIDTGTNGPAYPVHIAWLHSGRWGIEGMAGLDQVPAAGATLIVGVPPVDGATGMPIRAIAMF